MIQPNDLENVETLQKTINFLNRVGVKTHFVDSIASLILIPSDILWEGVLMKNGQLFCTKEAHPGDLLHEAGHLATAPSKIRNDLTGEISPEMALDFTGETDDPYLYWSDNAATGWAFYATLEIGIDSKLPFQNGFAGYDWTDVWYAVYLGWETGLGSKESCDLYYAGMIESKGAKTMKKWIQD